MIENIYPLTPLQEGLYYHWLQEPGSTAYIIRMSYRLKGTVDIALVEESCNILARRHPVLRTFFTRDLGEKTLQVVRKEPLPVFHCKEAGEDLSVDAIRAQDLHMGFDLHKGPLMRLTVVRLPDDESEFIWSHHHIIMDGWSVNILMKEFFTIYGALLMGRKAMLSHTHLYSGYISWLMNIDRAASLRYWSSYLEGFAASSLLQPDRGSDNVARDVREKFFCLSAAESSDLHAVCSRFGITANTFIQAAWGILMGIYNDTDDVVFGAVVSGRPGELEGVEEMIGLFSNTVPVRIRMEPSATVDQLLKNIHDQAVESARHHYVQLAEIQSQSELGRNLFNHLIAFQNFPVAEMVRNSIGEGGDGTGLSLQSTDGFAQTEYDLVLLVYDHAEMQIKFEYNAARHSEHQLHRLWDHFHRIICQMVFTPHRLVRETDCLSEQERHLLLHTFNDTSTAFAGPSSVLALFSEQVRRTPTAAAIGFGTLSLSYRELDELSGRIAHLLATVYRLLPGSLAGVLMDRSEKTIIALLAIWKTGAGYVPIDLQYPDERKGYMLDDTGIDVLLMDGSSVSCPAGYDGRVVDMNNDSLYNETFPIMQPVGDDPSLPAYVIYTSGSTGDPKGCVITRANLFNYIRWANSYYFEPTAKPSFPFFTSLSFDLTVTSIFCTLTLGGTLHIFGQEDELQDVLYRCFAGDSIDSIKLTPSHAGILEHIALDRTAVACVILGGEAVLPEHVRLLKEMNPSIHVYNEYGPTETTVGCTIEELSADRPVIIGKPIANTRVYILDRHDRLCPTMVEGEIVIAGAGVAKGYLHKQALTERKFCPDPFFSSARMYRTGDRGRWQQDGTLVFMGRTDDQVKINGHRIELGEITGVLSRHSSVGAATVVVHIEEGYSSLAAYYTTTSQLSGESVREYLSAHLPGYMVPEFMVEMKELPLTVNGKIDKRALPWPDTGQENKADSGREPANDKERLLVSVLGEVLKKPGVRISDNFFQLGGDSIKSIQIGARLKQKGFSLAIRDIVSFPVLEDMAKRMEKTVRIADQGEIRGVIPLTPIQHYFFRNTTVDVHHYNQSVLLECKAPVSPEGIRAVFDKLVRHHDALRMVFHKRPEGWVQDNKGLEISYSFEEMDSADEDVFVRQCEDVQSGFDLDTGPLCRIVLFRINGQHQRLLLVIHHLVTDGVSWRILLEDMSSLYHKFLAGEALTLPHKTDAFRDWQSRQIRYGQSQELKNEEPFWRHMEETAVPPLPTDMPDGTNFLKDTAEVSFVLGEGMTRRLLTECYKVYKTEINDILLTSLHIALEKTFGLKKILIGMEGHGREPIGGDIDVRRTVGWFTTLYPIVFDAPGDDVVPHLISVKEKLNSIPNKGIGYGILRYLEGKDFCLEPQITFNYLGDFSAGPDGQTENPLFEFSGAYHGRDVSALRARNTLLDVSGMVVGGRLKLSLAYSTRQYHRATMETLMDAYHRSLEELIEMLGSGTDDELIPASFNQQFYFSPWKVESDVVVSTYTYPHPDLQAFRIAIRQLVERHEILRTVFFRKNGALMQRILPMDHVDLSIKDPVPLSSEDEVKGLLRAEWAAKFAAGRFPLFDIKLFAFDSGNTFLIFTLHHAITDGFSDGILERDLTALYQAVLENRPSGLPVLRHQYRDFSDWQRHFITSAEGARHKNYWVTRLDGFDPFFVPAFSSGGQPHDSERLSVKLVGLIEGDLLEDVGRFARDSGLTRAVLLMGSLVLLISQLLEKEDVTVVTALSGRDSAHFGTLEIDQLLGCFVNVLFVRNRIEKDQTLIRYLRAVQDGFLNDLHHGDYPFGQVIRDIPDMAPDEDFLNSFVFFNYHNYDYFKDSVFSLRSTGESPEGEDDVPLKCRFGLTVTEFRNCLKVVLMFHPSLFTRPQRVGIRDQYFSILRQILEHPDHTVRQIGSLIIEDQKEPI